MNLTEFHSGYRAYNLHALRSIDFSQHDRRFPLRYGNHHQAAPSGMTIREVPIPTYYGTELCYVDGLKYAERCGALRVALQADLPQRRRARPSSTNTSSTTRSSTRRHSSHYYARQLVGRDQDVLDIGCGEGFFAAELKKRRQSRRRRGRHRRAPQRTKALEQFITADLNARAPAWSASSARSRFDRVLLLDVLEHLVQPERLLARGPPAR